MEYEITMKDGTKLTGFDIYAKSKYDLHIGYLKENVSSETFTPINPHLKKQMGYCGKFTEEEKSILSVKPEQPTDTIIITADELLIC